MYSIKVQQFEGPLDLLLQLIEQQELDISQVSLANVTDQYITTLHESTNLHPEELADFLVVAAKLLYIKSKILLPGLLQDDDGGTDLERQLKMYQEFVAAAKRVNEIFLGRHVMFGREYQSQMAPIFSPPKRLASDDLREVFRQLLLDLEPIINIPRETLKRTINLRHKIDEIHALLKGAGPTHFHALLRKAKDRTEVIVTFLALLELVKQRQLNVTQDRMFHTIAIESVPEETL
jgi:segregation and condensation protein A